MTEKGKHPYDPERRGNFTEEDINKLIDEILDGPSKPDPDKCKTLKDALNQLRDAAKDRRDKALRKCTGSK